MRRIVALALVPLAVAALSSCASPPYRFVSSAEGDVVLEVPRDWGRVSADEVREAQAAAAGQAEAQAEDDGSWVEYYDAASRPAPAHVTATTARQPVLIAQSAPLDAQVRQTLTADGLKDLLLPVSAEGRAQMAVTAAASAKEAPQFRLLSDSTVDTPTAKGVHVVFGYDFGDGMEIYDKVAVTDPKRTRVHLLLVHCAKSCYDARKAEIARVTGSFTVKSAP